MPVYKRAGDAGAASKTSVDSGSRKEGYITRTVAHPDPGVEQGTNKVHADCYFVRKEHEKR